MGLELRNNSAQDYLGDFEQRIAGLGANLLLAEYRGYGMSSGEPALAAMLEDVRLIVEACAVPPERIIFFGRSLGSLYALHGASLYPQSAGLIIESGLADPLERILVRIEPRHLGGTMDELKNEVDRCFNQQAKITSFTGRVLILHTRNDDLVSVRHAERLYNWANEPKELVLFERGDHNTILSVNEEEYFVKVGSQLGPRLAALEGPRREADSRWSARVLSGLRQDPGDDPAAGSPRLPPFPCHDRLCGHS